MEFGNRHNVLPWKPQGCGLLAAGNGFAPFNRHIELCFCYRHKKSDLNGRFFRSQAFTGYKITGIGSSVTYCRPRAFWLGLSSSAIPHIFGGYTF